VNPTRQEQILIRLATASDADQIHTVLFNSFKEFELLYTPQAFAATVPTADQIQARLDEGPTWIALDHKEIVGTVSAVAKESGIYIRSMAVAPSARGKRIGHKLLETIEDFASSQALTILFLSTTPFLDRAIKLYENHGFKRSTEGPDDLFGTPLFTMIKLLPVAPTRHRSQTKAVAKPLSE